MLTGSDSKVMWISSDCPRNPRYREVPGIFHYNLWVDLAVNGAVRGWEIHNLFDHQQDTLDVSRPRCLLLGYAWCVGIFGEVRISVPGPCLLWPLC